MSRTIAETIGPPIKISTDNGRYTTPNLENLRMFRHKQVGNQIDTAGGISRLCNATEGDGRATMDVAVIHLPEAMKADKDEDHMRRTKDSHHRHSAAHQSSSEIQQRRYNI